MILDTDDEDSADGGDNGKGAEEDVGQGIAEDVDGEAIAQEIMEEI